MKISPITTVKSFRKVCRGIKDKHQYALNVNNFRNSNLSM